MVFTTHFWIGDGSTTLPPQSKLPSQIARFVPKTAVIQGRVSSTGCQHWHKLLDLPGPADRDPHPIQKNLGHHHTLRLKLSGSSSGFLFGKTKPKFGYLSSGKLTKNCGNPWVSLGNWSTKGGFSISRFIYWKVYPHLSSMKQLRCPDRGRFRCGRLDSPWNGCPLAAALA